MVDASSSPGGIPKPRFKPIIVFATPPSYAQTCPLLPYAAHLQKKGHTVFFIAGAQFKEAITRIGVHHVSLPHSSTPEGAPPDNTAPSCPPEQTPYLWEHRQKFLYGKAECVRALSIALEMVHIAFGWKEIVVVEEMMFMGSWPFLLGAPLPDMLSQLPKVISFSSTPVWVSSRDTAPFGDGVLPERTSTEGRARNVALYQEREAAHEDLAARANEVYASFGATEKIVLLQTDDGIQKTMLDAWATGHEILVQPCSPSLEYPRSDLPSNIRFIGCALTPELDPSMTLPSWWGVLEANKCAANSAKVVFVTQGTAAISNYDDLIKPALTGLGVRDDVLVVAVLGKEGATLNGFNVPRNAYIQDNLPYHAILPYADVFVSNSGYGDFIQAVMSGVPMVLAGTTQDKAEVAARGEWAGIAVNLRTDIPTADAIRAGVDRVLEHGKFKARVQEIQRENEELDSLVQLERLIMEAAVDSEMSRPLTGLYAELVASKTEAGNGGSARESGSGSSKGGR